MGALEDSKKYLPGWRCGGICENCHGWCSFALAADTALKAIQQLEQELAAIKRERDAAIHDLSVEVRFQSDCKTCKHADTLCENDLHCLDCMDEECKCKTCSEQFNYEWRGVCDANTKEDAEK